MDPSSSDDPMTYASSVGSWDDFLDLFREHLRSLGRTRGTINSYLVHLRSLAALVPEGPELVLPADVEVWIEQSEGSARIRRSVAHTCFTWAVRQGMLIASPAPRPQGPGPGRPGPSPMLVARLNRSPAGRQWHAWIMAFGDWQRAADFSPRTIRLYNYRLTDLALVAGCGPEAVTERLLLHQLGNPRWKHETKRSTRSIYRAFFRWALKAGRTSTNPAAELPSVRVPPRIPRPTPEAVLDAALRKAEEREEFLLLLGSIGGLRCMEMAPIHESDWDGNGVLRVVGKGRKVRLVPITDGRLVELLNGVRGYAFPNRWTGEPITPGYVTVLLSQALAETYTGHTLRHRMATEGLALTGDILAVSRILGHASISTTQLYTLLDDDRVFAVARAVAGRNRRAATTSVFDEARLLPKVENDYDSAPLHEQGSLW